MASPKVAYKPTPDEAVATYGRLIKRTALRVADTMPWAEIDELIQWGTVGLLEALERFDPSRGRPFEAFAYQRIRGAMIDSLRREGTQARVAGAEPQQLDDTGAFGSQSQDLNPASLVMDAANHERVTTAIAELSQRQQLVLYLFYTREHNNREIARALEVSEASVSQMHRRAIKRVQSILDSNEESSGDTP